MQKDFRSIAFLLLALSCSSPLLAQDKITMRDGTVTEGTVTQITSRTITYSRADNPNGPTYTIKKGYVTNIVYANGTTEPLIIRRHGPDRMPNRDTTFTAADYTMGRNIFSFAPLQITQESVTGFGLSYERVLMHSGRLSFILPATLSIINGNIYGISGTTGVGNLENKRTYAYFFYPGFKVYPAATSFQKLSYAIAGSLVFGFGTEYERRNVGLFSTGNPAYDMFTFQKFGLMASQSLNYMAGRHLSLNLEIGLGYSFLADYSPGKDYRKYNGSNNFFSEKELVQIGFKMGYRF